MKKINDDREKKVKGKARQDKTRKHRVKFYLVKNSAI